LRTQETYKFDSIPDIVDELKQGNIIILVDDEHRENEGDLVIPADKVTQEIITFMAKKGSGLICLPMSEKNLDKLNLLPMVAQNTSKRSTAFTVSIEAKEGVTTGISAYDRAHTILTAINPVAKPEDLARPGHIFPLRAKDGGVLIRPGQTEGAVDLSKMANCSPNATICEIMNDDGTMARLPQLFEFAQEHRLKITTIKDLIIYRMNNEKLIRKIDTRNIQINNVNAELNVYKSGLLGEWYISMSYGKVDDGVIPAYLHKQSVISDVIEILATGGKSKGLFDFINGCIEEDKGVLIFLCNETTTEIDNELSVRYNENSSDITKTDDYMFKWLRNLGISASILKDLSIKNIDLRKTNLTGIKEISRFGINVTDTI